MAGKALQFLKKLNELPEEVGLYFDSAAETEASKEIEKDFQLSSANLSDLVRDIFIANFDFSVLDNGLKATNVPTPSQSKLAADILGKLFLPVASFLNLDIKAEIIKRGHRPELYQKYEEDLVSLVEEKNVQALEELVELHENTFNPVEEENSSLDLFNNGLTGILNDSGSEAIFSLNGGLIYLLNNKPDFHNKINKALLGNQEVITAQNLNWAEGPVRGTVANWLKDFIKENGSDNYNSVVLSRYLATSPNPQLLSEEERKIIRRLLKLYHNLIFFPESMNDVPMEEWEIIPVEKISVERPIVSANKPAVEPQEIEKEIAPVAKKTEAPKVAVKAPISLPVVPVEKKIEAPQAPFSLPASPAPVMTEASIPKIEADLEDSKLASLLTKYPADSLEAKIVREEIKKRQK